MIREVSADAMVHRGLAEMFGRARRVLDIRYRLGDNIFADGFESQSRLCV